ncbi:MAG: tetratricopeptide repeat protein, partial [Gemmatimonadetes bacterium]|nr:tetratricopeptide repeat protein [Gemmatimonadota bacterium]
LHFLVRQEDLGPLRILGTYNTDHREQNPQLVQMERSLLSLRRLSVHHLEALTASDTSELIVGTFGTRGHAVDEFAHMLYGWTKGNPYFIEQTLDHLVDTGRLHRRDNTWVGWGTESLELAPTVLDTVVTRLAASGPDASSIGEVLAVAGGRCPTRVLFRASGLEPAAAQGGVEELLDLFLVEESESVRGGVSVEFRHPLTREALYQRLPLSRRAQLHRAMAESLETDDPRGTEGLVDELAYHYSRAGLGAGDSRAAGYLAAAGRSALQRHANREAVSYLEAALEWGSEASTDHERSSGPGGVREDLARALGRMGRYEEARVLWVGLLDAAESPEAVAEAHRHLALFAFWSGDPGQALDHHEEAVAAVAGRNPHAEARLHLAAGVALQELGRPGEASKRLDRALPLAEDAGDESTLARVHWALALLKTWTGEAAQARGHAAKAVEKAEQAGDRLALFRARWVLAALEGLMGNTESMRELMVQARFDVEDLGSPALRLWVAELEVKYAWARGEWGRGISEGEAAISLARALNQRVLLSRLMVWTSIIYVGRGAFDRARALCEEAWELSGAGRSDPRAMDVHGVIPAHIGRMAYAISQDDLDTAIALGEQGLEIAQRSGYRTWVLDLLPLLMEAYLRAERYSDADAAADRMKAAAAEMDHSLARAWAAACDALVGWQTEGTSEETILRLKAAADGLREIPIRYDSARLRRLLVGRLAELKRRDEALRQLRIVWDEMSEMGAQPELAKAREMYYELDSRPPIPAPLDAERKAALTAKEMAVAQCVARRMTTAQIAQELGMAHRTVTTHLSNIYKRLGLTKDEYGDRLREELRRLVVEGHL